MQKEPSLSQTEILSFLRHEFPQVFVDETALTVEEVAWGKAQIRLKPERRHLRPGETISGPTMMMMTDCCAYICVLSVIGDEALAVTTNLNINFLRKPQQSDLICVASPLKVGKSLFVTECTLFAADDPEQKAVAHATVTYSIPPKRIEAN